MVSVEFINYTYVIIDTLSNKAYIVDPSWDFRKIPKLLLYYRVRLKGVFEKSKCLSILIK
jgi:hypothetical protein